MKSVLPIWSYLLFFTTLTNGQQELVFPDGLDQSILCTVEDDDRYAINWVDDMGPVTNRFLVGEEEMLADGMKGKRISFTATPDVNNTHLKCIVTDLHPPTSSSISLSVKIIIQGRLSPPDVEYYVNNRSVLFIWTPPFSLNITNVEPDISYYTVHIFRGDILETVNVIDTQFLLESVGCQLRVNQVEIAAVSIVSVGEKYTSPLITLDEFSVIDVGVDLLQSRFPIINIMVDTNCLNVTIDCHIDIYPGNIKYTASIIAIASSQQIIISSPELRLDEYYTGSVMIGEDMSSQQNISFSTFDVQSVEIKEYSGDVHIICHFAVGSNLRACRIALTTSHHQHCDSVHTGTRNSGSLAAAVVVSLPNGEYRAEIYDGDSYDSKPAQSQIFVVSFSKQDMCGISGAPDDADECNSYSLILMTVTLGVLIVAVAITCIITLLCCKKQCSSRSIVPTMTQQKYSMDENPVYAGHSTALKKESGPAPQHDYEMVNPPLTNNPIKYVD